MWSFSGPKLSLLIIYLFRRHIVKSHTICSNIYINTQITTNSNNCLVTIAHSYHYFCIAALLALLSSPIDTLITIPVYAEQQQKEQQNIYTIIPAVIQNLLTIVSFLIGTASFILGLSIQNAERSTPIMKRSFKILILALVVPSVIIITYRIVLIGRPLGPEDADY
jgi:hypothetical protein